METGSGSVTFSPGGVSLSPVTGGGAATCTWTAALGRAVVLEVANVLPGDAFSQLQFGVSNVDLVSSSPAGDAYTLQFDQSPVVFGGASVDTTSARYWVLIIDKASSMVTGGYSSDLMNSTAFGSATVPNPGNAIVVSASCASACGMTATITSLKVCP